MVVYAIPLLWSFPIDIKVALNAFRPHFFVIGVRVGIVPQEGWSSGTVDINDTIVVDIF